MSISKIIEWLTTENCFSWFAGDGLAFVLICLITAGVVAIFCSKKLRKMFF